MGQQQLILLVLATVIVGIAIVVGIRAFTENSAKSNADALMQDAVRMANDAQAWKKKPTPFGGAGTAALGTATLGVLGYPVGNNDATPADGAGAYENINGIFSVTNATGELVITGNSYDPDTPADILNTVVVRVCGTTDEEIAGAITLINGQTASTAPAAGC